MSCPSKRPSFLGVWLDSARRSVGQKARTTQPTNQSVGFIHIGLGASFSHFRLRWALPEWNRLHPGRIRATLLLPKRDNCARFLLCLSLNNCSLSCLPRTFYVRRRNRLQRRQQRQYALTLAAGSAAQAADSKANNGSGGSRTGQAKCCIITTVRCGHAHTYTHRNNIHVLNSVLLCPDIYIYIHTQKHYGVCVCVCVYRHELMRRTNTTRWIQQSTS